jgi:hypothetical protein
MKPLSTLALLAACLPAAAWSQHENHGTPPASAAEALRPPTPREWTRQPLLLPGKNPRGERSQALLRVQGIAPAALSVHAPEGPAERRKVDYPLVPEGAQIAPAAPQAGNYHWVVAREESADAVKVASTAWYFSNPGDSPKDLLQTVKHELEIVPDPLPREHGNYRESEKWRFLVRFEGRPLADQALTLETEFGSRSTFLTDRNGVATVLFPRDFKPATDKTGGEGHGPRRAKFVLATERQTEGRRYLTAFNLTYGQDADRERSLGWGAAFGLVGMLAATPLLRRKNGMSGDAKNA